MLELHKLQKYFDEIDTSNGKRYYFKNENIKYKDIYNIL